jgi:hypothetical protein
MEGEMDQHMADDFFGLAVALARAKADEVAIESALMSLVQTEKQNANDKQKLDS